MKKGKLVGNEIHWYKPFALVKRNKELELLTQTQFTHLSSYSDEVRELKSRIKNREKAIEEMEKSLNNINMFHEKEKDKLRKDNKHLQSKIIDLENNIELLFNNLSKTKQKQIRG